MSTYTRAQYMSGEVTHDAYYGQFVDSAVRTIVARRIGVERIRRSKDEHMNDIPLDLWDAFEPTLREHCYKAVKAAGDTWSLSTNVCIAKAAARRIKDEQVAA